MSKELEYKIIGDGGIVTSASGVGPTADVNIDEVAGVTTAAGNGAATAGTLRTATASDSPEVVSLAIMDDWDDGADHCEVVDPYKPATTVATGGVAIAATTAVAAPFAFVGMTLHLVGGLPTTTEDFTVTLNAQAGAAYDTLLFSLDLSVDSTIDLSIGPDDLGQNEFESGDELVVAWPNTETRTYGLRLTTRQI